MAGPGSYPTESAVLSAPHSIIDWLLAGDISIQYQVWRDLLDEDRPDLQARIATEGFGHSLLLARQCDGTWGEGFCRPDWTSSHYTLLDLKNLAIDPQHPEIRASVALIGRTEKQPDGGIGPGQLLSQSDVCINAMFLNYASYFGEPESTLRSVVDFLIGQHMPDGAFNCRSNRGRPVHSSLHSTVSVLEGLRQYRISGYTYRLEKLESIMAECVEFMLMHRLFRSDRTGEIIHPDFLKLPYPWRWRYNILRALDCLAGLGLAWDERMQDGVDALLARRRPDGRWNANAAHRGTVHVVMDKAGQPGRWNTLIAMRALRNLKRLPASGDRGSGHT